MMEKVNKIPKFAPALEHVHKYSTLSHSPIASHNYFQLPEKKNGSAHHFALRYVYHLLNMDDG